MKYLNLLALCAMLGAAIVCFFKGKSLEGAVWLCCYELTAARYARERGQ